MLTFQSLSPGVTTTEIFEAGGFSKSSPNPLEALPAVKSDDISNSVLYLLSVPYYVNITELTIKHVSQKF